MTKDISTTLPHDSRILSSRNSCLPKFQTSGHTKGTRFFVIMRLIADVDQRGKKFMSTIPFDANNSKVLTFNAIDKM